jgi:hypothetical protein
MFDCNYPILHASLFDSYLFLAGLPVARRERETPVTTGRLPKVI